MEELHRAPTGAPNALGGQPPGKAQSVATPKRKSAANAEGEAAPHPRELATIAAKAFYQELVNAGFDFNQIAWAASEIISELSRSIRARGK